jgi:hypothetical protein
MEEKVAFLFTALLTFNLENFKYHITAEERDTKIQLPKEFIWKLAEAAKTKLMHITTPSLNFDHSGKNACYSDVEFKGPT